MQMSNDEAATYVDMSNTIGTASRTFIDLYKSHPEMRHRFPWVCRAAGAKAYDVMRFLLDQGHSPDERYDLYGSALSIVIAAEEGCLDCIQLLLDAGA